MPGEQKRRRPITQADHRNAGLERLDREHELSAQRLGEVSDVGLDVAARQVDEVEPLEQGLQASRRAPGWRGWRGRDAGLITGRRAGRAVLYVRIPTGDALASQPAAGGHGTSG